MDLIATSKDTDWQAGLKRKIQQSAAYKRLTSSTEISTVERKDRRRFTKPMSSQKQARVAIQFSDKVDFILTLINEIKKDIPY
jgi:hypothetical protein